MELSITQFDPIIQTTIQYFANPNTSFQDLGYDLNISKQAVQQRVKQGAAYLSKFNKNKIEVDSSKLSIAHAKIKKLENLICHLRRELIVKGTKIYLLNIFKEKVLSFMPRSEVKRYQAGQKKHILDMLTRYKASGGKLTQFCKGIGKSSATIRKWKKNYEEKGILGLYDKITRPKHFGNKLPSWVKRQFLALMFKFPNWTAYQYHNHIKHNPAINYYVSLPIIKKLKVIYNEKSTLEKERIKKRWAFAKGANVWTIDFTHIQKTDGYILQLLTVSDHRTRFLFDCSLHLSTSTAIVMEHLMELFLKYGKPDIIKADNGKEFKTNCKEQLEEYCVYLLHSPTWYGQFNGAHERLHRTLKAYITEFKNHHNLTRLVYEIDNFRDEYNHDIPSDYLDGKTPAEIFYGDNDFEPKNVEIVKPYEKDGELRLKFKNRNNKPARLALDLIDKKDKTTTAIVNQMLAMAVTRFDIGVRDENSGKMINRIGWTIEEVKKSISWLKKMNSTGNHIYIRPSGKHNLSLIDDVDKHQIGLMKHNGYQPALVIKTSPDNYQVWIKHDCILDAATSTQAAKELARKFSGDPSSADHRHYGRACGFTNCKPKYKQQNNTFPYTLLIEAEGKIYDNANEYIKGIKKILRVKPLRHARQQKDANHSCDNLQNIRTIYDFHRDSRYNGDFHRADMAWACYASNKGILPEEIVNDILNSRNLTHKGSYKRQLEYARRTAIKAGKIKNE